MKVNAANDTLQRLSLGLLNRCRQKVYLGMSEMDVSGYENRGLLLRIFQQVLLESKRGQNERRHYQAPPWAAADPAI